jgi:hypothetical protein
MELKTHRCPAGESEDHILLTYSLYLRDGKWYEHSMHSQREEPIYPEGIEYFCPHCKIKLDL